MFAAGVDAPPLWKYVRKSMCFFTLFFSAILRRPGGYLVELRAWMMTSFVENQMPCWSWYTYFLVNQGSRL